MKRGALGYYQAFIHWIRKGNASCMRAQQWQHGYSQRVRRPE